MLGDDRMESAGGAEAGAAMVDDPLDEAVQLLGNIQEELQAARDALSAAVLPSALFKVQPRGGLWTAVHKGRIYDSFQGTRGIDDCRCCVRDVLLDVIQVSVTLSPGGDSYATAHRHHNPSGAPIPLAGSAIHLSLTARTPPPTSIPSFAGMRTCSSHGPVLESSPSTRSHSIKFWGGGFGCL